MSPKEKNGGGNTIAIISLIVTLIAAVLGSPVLVEWIKSQQVPETPIAVITQIQPNDTESPASATPLPEFTKQVPIFHEDFENDKVSGFGYEGEWLVAKDKNNQVLRGSAEAGTLSKATFGPSDFHNGIIEFRIRIEQFSSDHDISIGFRITGQSMYSLSFQPNKIILGFRDRDDGMSLVPFSNETSRALVFEPNTWYLIRIEARGTELIVYIDNNRIISADDERLSKGGLRFGLGAGTQAYFDDVNVWELK